MLESMEETRTDVPRVVAPVVRGRRPELDPFKWTVAARLTQSIPTLVTIVCLAWLALGPRNEPGVIRAAMVAVVLVASLYQAYRLTDRRRRLIASEDQANHRLIQAEERQRTLLERLPAAVYLDRYRRSDGAFLDAEYASPQMEELTGYTVEALKRDPGLWLTVVHPDDRERVAVDVKSYLSGAPIEQEYRIVRADGQVIWIREEARVIASSDKETMLAHGFLVDITDRKALEQQLGNLAFHDPLTGLANRALFGDRLAQAFARREGPRPVVLFIDLDEFKTVNDSLGHGAGDRLLQVVGARLRAAVRPSDCVARLGGDEFAVLLEDAVSADAAIATANRLLEVLRAPIDIEGRQVIGRGSIGIAVAGATSASPDDLLRDADAAMYKAKESGRDSWVLFEPAMHTAALARFDLEADLRVAVANDDLWVAYQPIYSLTTGRLHSAEALARWDHPTLGSISPVVFIPIAEDSDLITHIGRAVLGKACRQAAAWRRDGVADEDFAISVNVSAKQLTAALPKIVADTLAAAGLPARNLIVEVTESAVMRDAGRAIETLAALRATGVSVAVDDFGTGYSSLGYLQTLPVDVIKIDRIFVAGVEKPFESALIRAVIQVAGALTLRTVAEGIETEAQAAALRDLGCQFGQGYLFGRPEPADAAAFAATLPTAA